jgi:hypothetical protein
MRSRRGLPLKLEEPPARSAADEGEAEEREGLRSAGAAFPAIDRRVAAELNHARLAWWSDSENASNRSRIASRKRES